MNLNSLAKALAALDEQLDREHREILGDRYTGQIMKDGALVRQIREQQRVERQYAQDKADFDKAVDEAQYYKTDDFRQEVMEALVEEGCTELQAQGRTRDQFHLFKEAQRLGLM